MNPSATNKGLLTGVVIYLVLIPASRLLIQSLLMPVGEGDVRFVQSNIYFATALGSAGGYFFAKLWCQLWVQDGRGGFLERIYESALVPLIPGLWAIAFMREPVQLSALARMTWPQLTTLAAIYLVLSDPLRIVRRVFSDAINASSLRWASKPGWSMTTVGPNGNPDLFFGHIFWNVGFFGIPVLLMS